MGNFGNEMESKDLRQPTLAILTSCSSVGLYLLVTLLHLKREGGLLYSFYQILFVVFSGGIEIIVSGVLEMKQKFLYCLWL